MKKPYDDDRYLRWADTLRKLIEEFINTEGNSKSSLREEVEAMIENIEEDE